MVRLTKTQAAPPAGRKPQAPAKTRRRRSWWKVPLLLVFAVAFLSSGWFSYKIASATDKIFTENTTGGSPVLQGKRLKDEDRVNILLIGIGGQGHDGPNLSDTIQVLSITPKENRASIISIPRDLYVQVPDSFQKVKINEVHAIGEDNQVEGGGPGLLKTTASDILGVPIHYFIRVDFDGFKQIVDSMGGVSIDVQERLYDPYYPRGYGYQVVDIRPGRVQMDGETALKYARSRETTSDFDRSRRQQQVMVAVRDKALNLQYLTNPGKISQMVEILGNRVKTDLSLGESQRLANLVKDIPATNVSSKVLDSSQTGLLYDSIGPGGAYILLPRAGNYSDIQAFARQLFENGDPSAEQATIEIQNASGRGGLARLEADTLGSYGYQVTNALNAPAPAQNTVIYDYANGAKPATVKFLQKRYGAQVIKQPAEAGGPNIRVIIGTSYQPSARGAN